MFVTAGVKPTPLVTTGPETTLVIVFVTLFPVTLIVVVLPEQMDPVAATAPKVGSGCTDKLIAAVPVPQELLPVTA